MKHPAAVRALSRVYADTHAAALEAAMRLGGGVRVGCCTWDAARGVGYTEGPAATAGSANTDAAAAAVTFQGSDDALLRRQLAQLGVSVPEARLRGKCAAKRLESVRARYALVAAPPTADELPSLTLSHDAGVAVSAFVGSGGAGAGAAPFASVGVDVVCLRRVKALCARPASRAALQKRAALGAALPQGCAEAARVLAAQWGAKECLAKALRRNALYTAPSEYDVEHGAEALLTGEGGGCGFALHGRAWEARQELLGGRHSGPPGSRHGVVTAVSTPENRYVVVLLGLY